MSKSVVEGNTEDKIMLWKPLSCREVRFICRITFVAFIATLFIGFVVMQEHGRGLEGVFFVAGGSS